MHQVAVDVEQAGAVIGFVHQVVAQILSYSVVGLDMNVGSKKEILCERKSAATREQRRFSAASGCARKL